MISAINSATNFKGIYSNKGVSFSNSQLRTIENIKETLGDKQETMDFFVGHGLIQNTVNLSRVVGMKKLGVGIHSNNVTWKEQYEIGTYDEEHPFKIEDLKIADKKQTSNLLWGLSLFALPIIGFIFCLFANPKVTIGYEPKVKNELIQKTDSLKQKADTLKNGLLKTLK